MYGVEAFAVGLDSRGGRRLRGFPGDSGQRPLCGQQRRRRCGRGAPQPDYGQDAGPAASTDPAVAKLTESLQALS